MRAAILAMAFLAATATAAPVRQTIDLGDPAALDTIAAQDPQRYEKIVRILRIAGDVSCETLPQMLKVREGAGNVRCSSAILLTSYPAKRHLRFELDDTAYVVNVVLRGPGGTLQPAR